jgi:hypothetical protein
MLKLFIYYNNIFNDYQWELHQNEKNNPRVWKFSKLLILPSYESYNFASS